MASIESHFVRENVPRLLGRYRLSYYKEDNCVEYFITRKGTKEQVSCAIIFSLNRNAKEIHVSRFCPDLYKEINSKYLSAACFYLLIHHFGSIYHLDKNYRVSLETRPATYKAFFSRLKHFDFQIKGLILPVTAEVLGKYPLLDIDASMIEKKIMGNGEIPFLV